MYCFLVRGFLTHWGRDKMPAVSQTAFSNGFSWMKIFQFRLQFHWSLFPKGPINNIPALVQIMAWRRPGDKPLSEPMKVSLPTRLLRRVLNDLGDGFDTSWTSLGHPGRTWVPFSQYISHWVVINCFILWGWSLIYDREPVKCHMRQFEISIGIDLAKYAWYFIRCSRN